MSQPLQRLIDRRARKCEVDLASADEAEAIAALHVRSASQAYADLASPDVLAREYDTAAKTALWKRVLPGRQDPTTPGFALAARLNGKLAGFLDCAVSAETTPASAEITALYVEPEAWRIGLGSVLIEQLDQELRASGVTTCYAWVLEPNQPAMRAYAAWQFASMGEAQTGPLGTEVQMRLELELSPTPAPTA